MSPTERPIKRFVIVIPGFLQRRGTPNGMVSLWRKLHAANAGPDCCVSLHLWDSNWADVAEWIWRLRPNQGQPDVVIAGYSWGGYSAVLLARQLEKRGIDVRSMVLSDPVYRHGFWGPIGWLGQWRAFWPFTKIELPGNVKNRVVFAQSSNLPAGHDVLLGCEFTGSVERLRPVRARTIEVKGVIHQFMDDHTPFHNLAMEAAGA